MINQLTAPVHEHLCYKLLPLNWKTIQSEWRAENKAVTHYRRLTDINNKHYTNKSPDTLHEAVPALHETVPAPHEAVRRHVDTQPILHKLFKCRHQLRHRAGYEGHSTSMNPPPLSKGVVASAQNSGFAPELF